MMMYPDIKKELECTNFYQYFQKELKKFPQEIKKIILEMVEKPFWFEIGKALNSFPITEEVDKFRLKQELEQYMESNNISDLDLDDELLELQKKGYVRVKTGSAPNYFCSFEFAQAINIMKTVEDDFIQPLVKKLRENPEFRKYKNLRQDLQLMIYSGLEK
jgi:hypothetical protein